jgi:hypothetical protein
MQSEEIDGLSRCGETDARISGHSEYAASLDNTDEYHDYGDHQQDMDESTERETGNETHRPEADEPGCLAG